MNWKLKAHTLAILSRCPGGRRIYRYLQCRLGTNKLDASEYLRRALEVVQMIRDSGKDPGRGTYFEIGTGWWPFVPFLLSLLGADRIITVDVNPWLSRDTAFRTYQALAVHLEFIAGQLGVDRGGLHKHYEAAAGAADLQELLRALRVEYRYPVNARRTDVADCSVDCVVSSNVLSHIPPQVLAEVHQEAFRILRPGGVSAHRIPLGDQFTGVDRSITPANFLRYGARRWWWYGGSGLAYNNRLRGVEHRRLIEKAGFSILSSRTRLSAEALEAITTGRLPVHSDFREFTPEELAADYMWLVGAKPEG